MVRIKWKESLLTAVLCGGVAWAQQPPTVPPAAGDSSILTLKQDGKPDQRCRIVKTHRTPDGKTEYQVQDLATGEIATIVESGSPTLTSTPVPSTPSPLPMAQPADKAVAGPSTPPVSRQWFPRPGRLPESPVVPLRTESGRLEPVSELAAGTPGASEAPPAPGLFQRVRRFFGRGEPDETPTTATPSRFLNGTSATPSSVMQRMPSAPATAESIPGTTLTPTPTRLSGASSTPLPAMQRMPSAPATIENVPSGTLTPAPSRSSFSTPAPTPALNGQGTAVPPQTSSPKPASPYSNLEPVQLTGAQTLQMASFSHHVGTLSRREVLTILRDSPYPSQREVAIETLAAANWHTDPNVIPTLIQTATEDAAPTVRATCVRCLVNMGANTGPVLETLHKLQSDPNAQVRREVQAACVAFSAQDSAPSSAGVVPAGLK